MARKDFDILLRAKKIIMIVLFAHLDNFTSAAYCVLEDCFLLFA